jgi:hypothetical protein
VAYGPAMCCVRSRTLTLSSACTVPSGSRVSVARISRGL